MAYSGRNLKFTLGDKFRFPKTKRRPFFGRFFLPLNLESIPPPLNRLKFRQHRHNTSKSRKYRKIPDKSAPIFRKINYAPSFKIHPVLQRFCPQARFTENFAGAKFRLPETPQSPVETSQSKRFHFLPENSAVPLRLVRFEYLGEFEKNFCEKLARQKCEFCAYPK